MTILYEEIFRASTEEGTYDEPVFSGYECEITPSGASITLWSRGYAEGFDFTSIEYLDGEGFDLCSVEEDFEWGAGMEEFYARNDLVPGATYIICYPEALPLSGLSLSGTRLEELEPGTLVWREFSGYQCNFCYREVRYATGYDPEGDDLDGKEEYTHHYCDRCFERAQRFLKNKERENRALSISEWLENYSSSEDAARAILEENLSDPAAAHPEWMKTAISAVSYSLEDGGVMASWVLDDDPEVEFYQAVKLAISAFRRHKETDYDELLAAGVDRQTARDLKRRV